MKFSEIVTQLGPLTPECHSLTLNPDCNPQVSKIAAIDEAVTGQLSYIEGEKFARWVGETAASALILPLDERLQGEAEARGIAWIASSEPRLLFARAIALFYRPFRPAPNIHPTAVIDASATIGQDVYIGPHVVIGKNVSIGDRAVIYANVVLYPEVEIGAGTILHANCTIHERTSIGPNCTIHSGAVIGGEGFGFVPTAEGWCKMEQSGRTVLEEGVEVGCNSNIDRPAVGETRIGSYTKLDNLVHVGHGCKVGSYCALAAQVGLAGGVKVGDRVLLGGQVGVANQAIIGRGAAATAQTGIHNNIEAGAVVSGSPAVSNKLYLKASAIYKRLPEMYRSMKEIRKKLNL